MILVPNGEWGTCGKVRRCGICFQCENYKTLTWQNRHEKHATNPLRTRIVRLLQNRNAKHHLKLQYHPGPWTSNRPTIWSLTQFSAIKLQINANGKIPASRQKTNRKQPQTFVLKERKSRKATKTTRKPERHHFLYERRVFRRLDVLNKCFELLFCSQAFGVVFSSLFCADSSFRFKISATTKTQRLEVKTLSPRHRKRQRCRD